MVGLKCPDHAISISILVLDTVTYRSSDLDFHTFGLRPSHEQISRILLGAQGDSNRFIQCQLTSTNHLLNALKNKVYNQQLMHILCTHVCTNIFFYIYNILYYILWTHYEIMPYPRKHQSILINMFTYLHISTKHAWQWQIHEPAERYLNTYQFTCYLCKYIQCYIHNHVMCVYIYTYYVACVTSY